MLKLKPSPIHGIGVFALKDYAKGEQVIFQYDTIVAHQLTEDAFRALPPYMQSEILDRTVFIEGEPLSFLDPNSEVDYRAFMNHSDTPNTDGIYAIRDINAGEEVTEDYRTMGAPHQLTREHMPFIWS